MGILSWFRGDRGDDATEGEDFRSGTDAFPRRTDVFLHGLERLPATGDGEFVSFSLVDDEDRWVQVTRDEGLLLNAVYPFKERPEEVLPSIGLELPSDCAIESWAPATHLTLRLAGGSNDVVAGLLGALFERLVGAPPDAAIRGRVGE